MRSSSTFIRALLALTALALSAAFTLAASFTEGFDGSAVLDWQAVSRTENPSGSGWGLVSSVVDESSNHLIDPHAGAAMATAGFGAVASGAGTISEWLVSPVIFNLSNGDKVSFYTRTVEGSAFPDRLELRLSTSGESADVGSTATSTGSFSVLLASVNPTLTVGGYPESWTLVEGTISGLPGPTTGRVAIRYFVTDGGPGGANSNRVAVDSFSYASNTPGLFKITSAALQPTGEMALKFLSEPGRVYRLDYSTDLATWAPLVDEVVSQGTVSRTGDAGRIDADPVVSVGMRHDKRRFYRVVDLGRTRAPAPSVAISRVTADSTYSGELSVTVTSTVGGGGRIGLVRLFVDGIQVASEAPDGDSVTLAVNTSEFSKGSHWIHATASASEVFAPDFNPAISPDRRPWSASSAPVRVGFDNFVSEWSFDPVRFRPDGASARTISARLDSAADWQMEIYDTAGGAVVRTFSGSGSKIAVSWDGRDGAGNLVPWGFYKHRITFGGAPAAMDMASASASSSSAAALPPDAPTKITVNISSSNYSAGAMFVEEYPVEAIPPLAPTPLTPLVPAPLEAERFISTMAEFGYGKKFSIKNPRVTDLVGQAYGGSGTMKTATFGYVVAHGRYGGSSARFFNMPGGGLVVTANGLLAYTPEDGLNEIPVQAMQIGDDTYPNSNCRWLLVAGCSVFTDDVVSPTISGSQAATYPLLGEIGHGALGFSTPAVIDCNLGANWAKASHTQRLNPTTGQYEMNSVINAWWAAGLRSQRGGQTKTGGDIVMRAIYRRAYYLEKAPFLRADVDPESVQGELVSRSRRVAPDVLTDTEMTP